MSVYLQAMADLLAGKDPDAPAEYAWLITRDRLAEQDGGKFGDAAGVSGPSNATDEQLDQLRAGKGKKFRMYDDDGEHYYDGLVLGDFDGFEPLDDYGRGNAGCTDIRYHVGGKWQSL